MELIDTHAHLDFPQFDGDREEAIKRALAAGVGCIINVCADLASSRAAIALAEDYPQVYAAVGIHPLTHPLAQDPVADEENLGERVRHHDAKTLTDEVLEELREMAHHPKVVAIGEIGLDFYRDLSPRDEQRRAFERQLALASEVGKPVIIHDRRAHEEVTAILRRWVEGGHQPSATRHKPAGVMHCFSGDLRMAQRCIDIGFYMSIAGPVTFKNARRLPEIVRQLPLGRLLVETDCPYLAPHPHRGRRNEPAYVKLVAQKVAEIKEVPPEMVACVTADNARELFGLRSA